MRAIIYSRASVFCDTACKSILRSPLLVSQAHTPRKNAINIHTHAEISCRTVLRSNCFACKRTRAILKQAYSLPTHPPFPSDCEVPQKAHAVNLFALYLHCRMQILYRCFIYFRTEEDRESSLRHPQGSPFSQQGRCHPKHLATQLKKHFATKEF